MTRQQFHTKAHFFLAILIAFNLAIAQWVPVFITLLFVNWLLEGDFKNKFSAIAKNKFALLFVSFYVLHLIGLSYTQNLPSGFFDVEVKLSLLLFPLIFASRPLDPVKTRQVFIAFIAGCAVSTIIMLVRAINIYLFTGEKNCFFYEAFSSFLIHPGYISMYLNVGIAWLMLNILQDKFASQRFSTTLAVSTVLFFTFIMVLLTSKIGLGLMILMHISFIAYYVVSRKKYYVGIIGLLIIISSFYYIKNNITQVAWRIETAIDAFKSTTPKQNETESTAVRLLIWKAANKVISEHPIIGAGTGDAKNSLIKEYENRGMIGAAEHKLNAHDEYYQVFVALGLIGFILLLCNLFFPLWWAFKTNNTIYVLFLLIIVLNFLTESMLETQAGVMFYAFFNSLLSFTDTEFINPNS